MPRNSCVALTSWPAAGTAARRASALGMGGKGAAGGCTSKLVQRLAGEPEGGPPVHGAGTKAAVEIDGGLVPVQHAPFHARVAVLHGDGGKVLQQGLAMPLAPCFRADVKVFQVDPV